MTQNPLTLAGDEFCVTYKIKKEIRPMFTAETAFNSLPQELQAKYQPRKEAIIARAVSRFEENADWDDDTGHENIVDVLSDAVQEWEKTDFPKDKLALVKNAVIQWQREDSKPIGWLDSIKAKFIGR
jgi:beta-xylosidase